jgi:hypothetical protein
MNENDKFNLKLLLIAWLLDNNFQAYTDWVKKNCFVGRVRVPITNKSQKKTLFPPLTNY